MAVLTIIGGPNGAGKSTHSKTMLSNQGIEAFDFDKEFYSIWSKFDFDPSIEDAVYDRTKDLYSERKSSALEVSRNFAFETNFHTPSVLSTARLFKSKGYKIELIFICLESVQVAIERVKERVAKGGHLVDEPTIRDRFIKGLELMNTNFQLFDIVSIYLSSYRKVQSIVLLEPPLKRIHQFSSIPSTLVEKLPLVEKFICDYRNL